MADVVIFGTGEIAEIAHFYLTHDSEHKVVAFTADQDYIQSNHLMDLPIIPFEEVERKFNPADHHMFVALSYSGINKLRALKYEQAKAKGYPLVSYVSTKATVWSEFRVGDNCFILEDNTIQPFAVIGNNVTLWSGNHIGHHSRIGDHCFISSHVVVSGGVVIEPYCFIGVNATLRDHITVRRESVLGAGVLITRDTMEKEVYKGAFSSPSKVPSNRLKKI